MTLVTDRGVSLVEALVAALLIAIAVSGLAHLVAAGAAQISITGDTGTALALASARLEELRAAEWRFGVDGARFSDQALALSPDTSLSADHEGYSDRLNRFGAPAASDGDVHYRRRWKVSLHDPADPDTLLLQACVFRGLRGAPAGPALACIWSIRTRKP